jgi:hypothetical protein
MEGLSKTGFPVNCPLTLCLDADPADRRHQVVARSSAGGLRDPADMNWIAWPPWQGAVEVRGRSYRDPDFTGAMGA